MSACREYLTLVHPRDTLVQTKILYLTLPYLTFVRPTRVRSYVVRPDPAKTPPSRRTRSVTLDQVRVQLALALLCWTSRQVGHILFKLNSFYFFLLPSFFFFFFVFIFQFPQSATLLNNIVRASQQRALIDKLSSLQSAILAQSENLSYMIQCKS